MKNIKQIIKEEINQVIAEMGSFAKELPIIGKKNATHITPGDVFEKNIPHQGRVRFVAMRYPKQSSRKNEYNVFSTVLDTTEEDSFFKKGMEVDVKFVQRYGNLTDVDFLGKMRDLRRAGKDNN